ncbi:hypothetical protein ACHAXS_011628 [Conticribra weissflogii]
MFRSSISILALFAILLTYASGVHTRAEDAKIMAKISREEGVVVTPSGLLYKELRPGKQDGMKPGHFEPCTMRWHNGTLIDRVTKPHHQDTPDNIIIRRRPSELIPGWAEALQRTKEGAMVEIYVPPFLGYRHLSEEMGIPKDAVYVITFELLKVHRGASADEL